MMTVKCTCISCHVDYSLNVKPLDYLRWSQGMHVQTAFPYLSPSERELFISGICGECYDKIFADEDEDEE